jgi:hypothetical protein
MKYSIFPIITFTIIIVSCNNESKKSVETTTPEDTSKPVENKVMIPNMVCYSGATGKDTFFLKLEKFPNVVAGSLSYKFYEKDSNKGDIDGKLNGDTLVADYNSCPGKTTHPPGISIKRQLQQKDMDHGRKRREMVFKISRSGF